MTRSEYHDPSCGNRACICTHTECDRGWLYKTGTEQVIHCPVCHPGREQRFSETRRQWQHRLQATGIRSNT